MKKEQSHHEISKVYIRFLDPENLSFAIFENEKSIAAACVHLGKEYNELESFFVAVDLENKGYGSEIWNCLENKFPAQRWCVSTPVYSTRNHYFYMKKCGFKHIEDRENISYFEKENL
ncbi:GNAT family N-acetyltransferase [Lactococcus nasutitermitis]|uniref:GNAT family N-acetyltransferase n=1 Tax=Lactococcus nasutitermitis TaxID=1652957 RepID=A0ABV9JIG8_9LACT|nr:GNAT family N-acetyltransferase [Lactococcus nasutitermitis]